MYDEQRMHFAQLCNKATEERNNDLRAMAQATKEANMGINGEKKDREQFLKQ